MSSIPPAGRNARRRAIVSALWLACVVACAPSPEDRLVELGVEPSVVGFRQAAAAGDAEAIALFIEAGFELDTADAHGRTPLIAAAEAGHPAVVARLLEAGADVGRALEDGSTALALAAESAGAEVVGLLLDAGADAATQDSSGNTALMRAAHAGCLACVEQLLGAGAHPDRRTPETGSHALGLAVASDRAAVVTRLVEGGADIELREAQLGATPLAVAAIKGATEAARVLIAHGADLSARNEGGETPLMLAANSGSLGVVQLLLVSGADPDDSNSGGATALMFAALAGHREIAEALLAHGADPGLATSRGYTALRAARDEGHAAVAAAIEAATGRVGAERPVRRWSPFAAGGGGFRMPMGWRVVDPLTSETTFWGDLSLLGVAASESPETRRALLQHELSRLQVLLIKGTTLEWMPRLYARLVDLEARLGEVDPDERRVASADGVAIECLDIARDAAGLAAARRHLLCVVDLGREIFVADAGGPADRFEADTVLRFLQTLHLDPVPARPAPR